MLAGIAAAEDAGFAAMKLNCVVMRGVNDTQVLGSDRALSRQRSHRALHRIHGRRHDQSVARRSRGAERRVDRAHRANDGRSSRSTRTIAARSPNVIAFVDGGGEIGFISSVSQPFCGDCTRARLSADGKLYTCLFAQNGYDLRTALRAGADDEALDRADRGTLAAARRPLQRTACGDARTRQDPSTSRCSRWAGERGKGRMAKKVRKTDPRDAKRAAAHGRRRRQGHGDGVQREAQRDRAFSDRGRATRCARAACARRKARSSTRRSSPARSR